MLELSFIHKLKIFFEVRFEETNETKKKKKGRTLQPIKREVSNML